VLFVDIEHPKIKNIKENSIVDLIIKPLSMIKITPLFVLGAKNSFKITHVFNSK